MTQQEKDWFKVFKNQINVVFTKEQYKGYTKATKNHIKIYKKYLKPKAMLIDCGCGLGANSIPLSKYGYKILGIDNNKQIIKYARINNRKFNGKVKFKVMDIFKIDKYFKKDSFDACIHGGVIEHFPKKQIPRILKKQLKVAPLIIFFSPINTKTTLKFYGVKNPTKSRVYFDGVYRNLWKPSYWINNVLKGFNVIEYKISKSHPIIYNVDEMMVVIKR